MAYERHGLGEHIAPPAVPAAAEHAYHLYVARHDRADELVARLSERGVGARGYYRVPAHRQPAMERWGRDAVLPGTDAAARNNVALPMGPLLSDDEVRQVVEACASGST